MSKKSGIQAGKSNWRCRVLKGCSLLLVLVSIGLVSLDFYLKKAVPDKLEQLMFDNGWRVLDHISKGLRPDCSFGMRFQM